MTANEINRGGRPKVYDWGPLAERVQSLEDLAVIEAAAREHTSHPEWARGCAGAVGKVTLGDPTGGVSRRMAYEYRKMLAEIPFDPLKPPGGRRRILRELARQRGGVEFAVLTGGALAGAVALFAPHTASEAVRIVGALIADNARDHPPEAGSGDSGARVVSLRRLDADGSRECVPSARKAPPATRAEYALEKAA